MFSKFLKYFSLNVALLAIMSSGFAMEVLRSEEDPSKFGSMAYVSSEASGLESAVELVRGICKKLEDYIEMSNCPRPRNPLDASCKSWLDSFRTIALETATEKDVRDSIFNCLEVLQKLNLSSDPSEYGPFEKLDCDYLGEKFLRLSLFCIEKGNKLFQDLGKHQKLWRYTDHRKYNDVIQFYTTSLGYLMQATRATDNFDIAFVNLSFYQAAIYNFYALTENLKDQLLTLCNEQMRSKFDGYPNFDFAHERFGKFASALFFGFVPDWDSSERNILGMHLWLQKVSEFESFIQRLLIIDLLIQNFNNKLQIDWSKFQMNSSIKSEGNPDPFHDSVPSVMRNYEDYSRLIWEARCGCELKEHYLLMEFSMSCQQPEKAAQYTQKAHDAYADAIKHYLENIYQGEYEPMPEWKEDYICWQLHALINPPPLIAQIYPYGGEDVGMDSLTASTDSYSSESYSTVNKETKEG